MNHWKTVLAVGLPALLAVGAFLLLFPGEEAREPVLSRALPEDGGAGSGGPVYGGTVPQEDWERVDPPASNVPDTPGTRPVPDVDEADVLDPETLEALLAAGTDAAWRRIQELLKTGRIVEEDALATRLVNALGEGGNSAAYAMHTLVLFRDEDLRHRAAEQLMTLANASNESQVLRAAFEAAGQLGDGSIVPDLADFARRLTDRAATVQALYAIAEIGAPESADALARFLAEQRGTALTDVVVTAIGRVKTPEMVHALRPFVEGAATPELRLDAAKAMARTGAPEAMVSLVGLLEEGMDRNLREVALEGLGRISTKESVEMLYRIRAEGGDLAFAAGLALGNARGAGAERVILSHIDGEEDERVRVRMIQALEGGALDESHEKLVGYLESKEQSTIVREYSARVLGRTGRAEAVGPLTKALADSSAGDTGLRISILNSLVKLAEVPAAAEALREKTRPVLEKMAADPVDEKESFWLQRALSVMRAR